MNKKKKLAREIKGAARKKQLNDIRQNGASSAIPRGKIFKDKTKYNRKNQPKDY
jgi:hypothetical protein